MEDRDGGSSSSLRSLDRMVRGPQAGWDLRRATILASISGAIWCGHRS